MPNNELEIGDLLDKLNQKYQESLASFSKNEIDEFIDMLQKNKDRIKVGEKYVKIEEGNLSENSKQILKLMRQYEKDIKQIFIENGQLLTHITDVSPENMRGGKIERSISRDNDCQTESGDWSFASSTPVDGKNLYMARKSKDGMKIFYDDSYIMGGDNFHIEKDETGRSHVVLNSPNYVYRINPEKFRPVTTLIKNKKTHKPMFRFTEEWISEEEVDITDEHQVPSYYEISDITEVIENYQIFCDVGKIGIADEIRSLFHPKDAKVSEEEKREIFNRMIERLEYYVASGELRYINGESGVNASPIGFSLSKKSKKDYEKMHQIEETQKIAMFHDQKSDWAFEMIDAGIHTINKEDVVQVAKKDSVVREKERVIQVRDINDKVNDENQEIK